MDWLNAYQPQHPHPQSFALQRVQPVVKVKRDPCDAQLVCRNLLEEGPNNQMWGLDELLQFLDVW